ncbi:MAG: hypothetical protein J3R72DRAFT_4621 [Linnemannia gamsii]|nr:MAG: hypothetical protein J3R72DRAFT_4621 [Linnemannia gamsii]
MDSIDTCLIVFAAALFFLLPSPFFSHLFTLSSQTHKTTTTATATATKTTTTISFLRLSSNNYRDRNHFIQTNKQ